MELSIIIVNYQSEEYLKKCLLSLRSKIKDFKPEIIVVNNDQEGLNLLGFKSTIINNNDNLGFGRANNIGEKAATKKYILFLNPDTEIISENISMLLEEFEKDNKIGIVGPKLLSEKNKTQEWIAGYETNLGNLIRNNIGFPKSKKIWESEEKKEAGWVTGAALFIRKDLFKKLGGFDENFFMYFEDEDLCKRARQMGYKIIYYPNFIVKHFGGKSFENKKEQKKYYYASQDYYFQKHFGKFTVFWVRALRKIFL